MKVVKELNRFISQFDDRYDVYRVLNSFAEHFIFANL